jgi:hypothetical protein
MKKKRRSSREFFERHREQFEKTDRLFRERLAYHEARRQAEREAAERKATKPSDSP